MILKTEEDFKFLTEHERLQRRVEELEHQAKDFDICALRACNFFCTWLGEHEISGVVPPTADEIRALFTPVCLWLGEK